MLTIKRGQTSVILRVKVLNSSLTTGAGLTGLTSSSAGLIISTIADNEATATVYTQASSNIETITTLGTYAAPTAGKCRFREVDATNHKGIYELQIADARFAVANAKAITISISGATNAAETDFRVRLLDVDPYNATTGGIANMDVAVSTRLAPTTAGRTLDVASTGEAGIDLGNVTGILTNTNLSFVDTNERIDVGSWLGTAVTLSATTNKPEVDISSVSDDATAANNLEIMFDGTGYAGGTTKLQVDTTLLLGGDPNTTIPDAVFNALYTSYNTDETFGLALRPLQSGTAQAGSTSTTIVLDGTNPSANDDEYNGCIVKIVDGTGVGQSRLITDYAFSGTTATVEPAWITTPSTNSKYVIVSSGNANLRTATQSSIDTTASDVTTLLGRITSSIFTGMTSLAQWIGLIAGKQTPDATALTEIRATGAGSGTFDPANDSNEAIADSGGGGPTAAQIADAVWDEASADHKTAGSFGEAAGGEDIPYASERKLHLIAGVGVTLTGGEVSTWSDQSGNGHDCTQATAADRPTPVVDRFGRQAIAFGNSNTEGNHHLVIPAGMTTDLADVSIFAVCSFYGRTTLPQSVISLDTSKGALGYWTDVSVTRDNGFVFTSNNAASGIKSTLKATNGIAAIGYSSDATSIRFYDSDRSSSATAMTGSTAGGLIGAWNLGGTNTFDGSVCEVVVFNRALTHLESLEVIDYLKGKWGIDTAENNLVFEGDSITEGFASTHNRNYQYHLKIKGCRVKNVGEYGDAWSQLLADGASLDSQQQYPDIKNVIIAFCGSNDIVALSRTAAQAAADAETWCKARKDAGWDHVGLITMLPRGSSAINTERLAYNALLRDGTTVPSADFVIDVEELPEMGTYPNNTNLAFYDADQLHPNSNGYERLAAFFGRKIAEYLDGPDPLLTDDYFAALKFTKDAGGAADRYVASWFKNDDPASPAASPAPTIRVVKASDGTDLIASTNMTQSGSTGSYYYNETTNLALAGQNYLMVVTATINGVSRTWKHTIGRDSTA